MDKILNIENYDDLLHFNVDAKDLPTTIIMHPSVLLPPQNGVTIDPAFEIRDAETMPYYMRKRYQHPGNYNFVLFASEVRERLKNLKQYVKKGNNVVFVIDIESPNSLLNACYLFGLIFINCEHNPGSPYPDNTDVPFPLRLSKSKPQCWLWSCHWPKRFPRTIDNPEEAKLFAEDNNNLDFPDYDGHHCCIRVIERREEGVTAFSVNVGKLDGKIIIVPATTSIDKIMGQVKTASISHALLEVLAFPKIFAGAQKTPVKLRLSVAGESFEYQVSLLRFLRFLVLYYCSADKRQMGFLSRGKIASELKLIEDGGESELPYEFLFKTTGGSHDSNFFSLLNDVRSCILHDSIPESERKQLESLCFFEGSKGRKYKDQYLIEKVQNTILEFSPEALENFMNFAIPNSSTTSNEHASELYKCLAQFKKDIQSVL